MKTKNYISKGLLAVLIAMLMPAGVWAQSFSTPVEATQNTDGTWSFIMPNSAVMGQVTVQDAYTPVDEPTETVELPTVGPDDDGFYYATHWGNYAYKIDGNTQAFIAHLEEGDLRLEEIVDHKIPQNTAVILRSKNHPITITPVPDCQYTQTPSGNELKGLPYDLSASYLRYTMAIVYGKPVFCQTKDHHGDVNIPEIPAYSAFYDLPANLLINYGDGVGPWYLDLDFDYTTDGLVQDSEEERTTRFIRTFDAGVASTVCLPADMPVGDNQHAYEFVGIAQDALGEWTATMQEPDLPVLVANRPYLFLSDVTSTIIWTVPFVPAQTRLSWTTETPTTVRVGDWVLHGMFEKRVWDEGDYDVFYGFSADEVAATAITEGVHAGDFVRVGKNTVIRPLRAFMEYCGTGSFPAPGRNGARPATQLPEKIKVVLLDKSGSTTAIGTLNTETGEASDWYDLSGRKLDKQPTQKGVYINNGKKVVKK